MRGKVNIEKWRKPGFYLAMAAMLTGLLYSRALLSSGMIFFAVISLFHKTIFHQLKVFFTSPFLWSMTLLFALPAISGLWSENVSQWSQVLRIKLPLLVLPVCFAGEINFESKDWRNISYIFLVLILAGICGSLLQYAQNMNAIHAAYLKAYTIETPLGNDHVRFSLLVVIAILTIVLLLVSEGKNYKKITRGLLVTLAVVDVIYMHVLAVRTGLVCFYLGAFVFLVWLLSQHKRKNLVFPILIFFLPLAAYFILPTFRNKIHYFKYDLSLAQKDLYVPGSSDGNRLASIKAGWETLKRNPLAGVGFGDIKDETEKFYGKNYPRMSISDKILPSSEWTIYGSGAGWPGVIFFSCVMLVPFIVKGLQKNISWIALNIFIAFSYLFDIGLEVQYGVFIHAFVLLWWYKWLQLKE
ncbi:MAG TPA: O-antigen ligase family protein [Chitinophagaceae bacterium]|nr:O-antigen ligase family protein [Chitinophagaceae bacterium]